MSSRAKRAKKRKSAPATRGAYELRSEMSDSKASTITDAEGEETKSKKARTELRCAACQRKANDDEQQVVALFDDVKAWTCEECVQWKAGSQKRKEAIGLWTCPATGIMFGGHVWTGAKLVQDCKCARCGIEHPGKKHANCAGCKAVIADHSEAYWDGAQAYHSKACMPNKKVKCSKCARTLKIEDCALEPKNRKPPVHLCRPCYRAKRAENPKCATCHKEVEKDKAFMKADGDEVYCSSTCRKDPLVSCDHCGNHVGSLEVDSWHQGGRHWCSELCYKMSHPDETGKCAECGSALLVAQANVLGDLHFCGQACERQYRDTHLTPKKYDRKARASPRRTCSYCRGDIAPFHLYADSHQPDKRFCSIACRDKDFEQVLLPSIEHRKKELGLDKVDCDQCGVAFFKREMTQEEDYPDCLFCPSCTAANNEDSGDEEEKKHVRTYTAEKSQGMWTFHLESTVHDDFKPITGTWGGVWNGVWLEGMPMKTSISVSYNRGPAAEMALKKMGYVSKPQKTRCLFCAQETDGTFAIDGEFFCNLQHAKWAGFTGKKKVKFTPVVCGFCQKKIQSKKAACEDSEIPGEYFCSEECMDERERAASAAKAAFKASGLA